ncbi:MAG TPA: hypothetical protein VJ302_10315 [Blastocatellia bacterium]|nr:hypothetical protein [Blastocatellia bacterium]
MNDRLLPEELNETETQTILREQRPRPHVEAALKVSDARINDALKLVQESQYKAAAEDFDVYAALIRYADHYTRKLPETQSKDRNYCLKKIEQAIFKQSRALEAVVREMPYADRDATERAVNEIKKIRLRAINDLLGGGGVINSSNE